MTPEKTPSGECPALELPAFKGNRRTWHINKSIDLGNLLVMLGMLVGALVWVFTRLGNQDIKINSVEEGLKNERVINERQDTTINQNQNQVHDDLKTINNKMDQLLIMQQRRSGYEQR